MSAIPNIATPDGAELGRHMARFCDQELAGEPDRRCATCAFRRGAHLANNSVATQMDALKACMQHDTFLCHERPGVCAGWVAMRFREAVEAPWPYVGTEGP